MFCVWPDIRLGALTHEALHANVCEKAQLSVLLPYIGHTHMYKAMLVVNIILWALQGATSNDCGCGRVVSAFNFCCGARDCMLNIVCGIANICVYVIVGYKHKF